MGPFECGRRCATFRVSIGKDVHLMHNLQVYLKKMLLNVHVNNAFFSSFF